MAHDYISYHPSSRQIMKFEDRRSSKPSHPGILAPPVDKASPSVGLLEPATDFVTDIKLLSDSERLYNAIEKAEHRSFKHRLNTWSPSGDKTSTAWGPVQIDNPTMGDLLRYTKGKDPVQSARWVKKNDPLTKDEEAYIKKYVGLSQKDKNKELRDTISRYTYNSIAKKYIRYLWEVRSGKDPKAFATLWHYGPSSLVRKKAINKGQMVDIVDKDYWEEFIGNYRR